VAAGGMSGAERIDRVPIRHTFKGLQQHDGGDHVAGYRWPAPLRWEQIREHVVAEQTAAMFSQKRLHRTLRDLT
jgi:hypothetical protein